MHTFRYVVVGLLAGACGAALWGAVGYYTNYEIGWVAWGIGFLVGLAVRVSAGSTTGRQPAITAALIALLAVAGGKYAGASLALQREFAHSSELVSDRALLLEIASDLVRGHERDYQWAPGTSFESARKIEDFPSEAQAKARLAFSQLSAEERATRIAARQKAFAALAQQAAGASALELVRRNLSLADPLWIALAMYTAFQVAGSSPSAGKSNSATTAPIAESDGAGI